MRDILHSKIQDLWPALPSLLSIIFIIPIIIKEPKFVKDTSLFAQGGIGLVSGTIPYADFWDIKPPAIYETVGLLALIVSPDRATVFPAAMVLSGLTVIISLLFVTLIAYELTDDRLVSIVAGCIPLTFPYMYSYLQMGPYVQYFATTFGLAAVYFHLKDYEAMSGFAAGLAAAYWQFIAIIPLTIIYKSLRKPSIRPIMGLGVAILVVTGPIIWLGAGSQMFIQTVIAAALYGTSKGIAYVPMLPLRLGPASIFVAAGIIGIGKLIRNHDSQLFVFKITGIYFVIMPVISKHAGKQDLIPVVCILAISCAVLLSRSMLSQKVVISGIVVVVSIITAQVLVWTQPLPEPAGGVYFSTISQCHIRMSSGERLWIEQTNTVRSAVKCQSDIIGVLKQIYWK